MQHLSIAALAAQAYKSFEQRSRDGGADYVTLRDDAPEWVRDLVRAAHGEFLPDDWRYASIMSAVGAIADEEIEPGDDAGDLEFSWADGNVDTYNSDRTAWLASNLTRPGYCDEAADELATDDTDIMSRIGLGQFVESREIFALVLRSLVARQMEEEERAEIADMEEENAQALDSIGE